MLETLAVYGDPSQLGCREVLVRFVDTKLTNVTHRVDQSLGAELILLNFSPVDASWVITYVNSANIILKRLAYARERVLEVALVDSVCRLAPLPPPKPILKAV